MGEGRFAGKVAIVSGGSHGIGRAIATGFADEGAQVVIADLAPPDFFSGNPQIAGITGDIAKPGAGKVGGGVPKAMSGFSLMLISAKAFFKNLFKFGKK